MIIFMVSTQSVEADATTKVRAQALIDAAADNARKFDAYATIYNGIRDNKPISIHNYVHNVNGRLFGLRTELFVASQERPTQTLYVTNPEGTWMRAGGDVVALSAPPKLLRDIPRQLSTARILRSQEPLEYEIEENITYFDMPAIRVTISVGRKLMESLIMHPESLAAPEFRSGLDETGASAKAVPNEAALERMYPVTYVYVLHKETPFVLSWEAYSFRGHRVYEINFQEFHLFDDLPERLFARIGSAPADKAAQPPRGKK